MANVKDLLVNGSARVIGTIYGNATSANKVNHSLTFGSKSFNGSSAQTITLADLGGKPTQSAVSSPSASGTEISFIDTISQNANGVITATKKTVRDASASQSGVVSTGTQSFKGTKTLDDGMLIIKPAGRSSWQEGIRILDANSGWTTLALGGSATSGTNASIWSMHTYQSNFYLAHNGSSSSSTGLLQSDASGNWRIDNSLGIGGKDTAYKLYVNGSSLFNGSIDLSGVLVVGTNNTWLSPSRVQIGRTGTTVYSDRSTIGTTNGNLHLDSYKGYGVYINYYSGKDNSDGTQGTMFSPNGNVNIGTSSDKGYKLYVNGTAYFTNYLQTASYLKSTIATGTAPIQVSSTTLNSNLNADLLDGWHKQDILGTYYVSSSTAGLSHYWCKIWSTTITGSQYNDLGISIYVQSQYDNKYGLFTWRVRQNGTNNSGAYNFTTALWEHFGNIASTDIRLYYDNATGVCEVWVNCWNQYGVWNYSVLKKCWRVNADATQIGTFYSTLFTTTQTMPTSTYISASYTPVLGNAATATQLQTARIIWGQSFNGTANITGNLSNVGSEMKLLSGKDRFQFLTSANAAAWGSFKGLYLSDSYTNTTTYRLHNDGTSYLNGTVVINAHTGNYGEGIRFIASNGQWVTLALGATSSAIGGGTNEYCWSIHRKDDNNFCISRNSSDGKNGLVLTTNSRCGIGTTTPSYKLHVTGDIYANGGWLRTSGNTGWYNETYGGGLYMSDSTYIRNYAGKTTRLDNLCLGADNNSYRLYVNGSGNITGNLKLDGSITNLAINGGIYWNPYVESASDASDAASITVLKSGAAGGTELRISQLNDANDIINFVTSKSIYLNSKNAFNIADSWLRINETNSFSSGIYTGSSLIRTDNELQVGGSGNHFYANSSGNGYFRNTLGIAGTNTSYKLYVNGTSYFNGDISRVGNIFPLANNNKNLGSSSIKWANIYATTFHGALDGNASTASKLATARTISLAGNLQGSATFDGSANITITALNYQAGIDGGNTNNYPWHRIAYVAVGTGQWNDKSSLLRIRHTYNGGGEGLIKISTRTNATSNGVQVSAVWLYRYNIPANAIGIGEWGVTGDNVYVDVYYKSPGSYPRAIVEMVSNNRLYTLVASNEVSNTTTSNKLTSTEVYTSIEVAATQLRGKAYTQIVYSGDGVANDRYVLKSGDTMTGNLTAPSVYTSNWFRSTGKSGWYNDTYGGGWCMTDSTYIRSFNSKTVRVDNLCLGADNNSYRLYVNGTSYFNGNTTHNGIDYFANGTTYYINNSADTNLRRGMFAGTSNASTAASSFYNSGALEIRESGRVGNAQSSFNFAPRIGFHWSGRIAASLSFHSDGIFYFRKQNGNDRATIDANVNGNAATATKLATARTISLTGSVTGSGTFDGSGNLNITTTTNHSHSYLPLAGGTMTGVIRSTYKSGSWVNSLTNSAISLDDASGSYGGWICGPTKDGRIAISTYQASNNTLYFGYGERGRTTNSFAQAMTWDGPTNTLSAGKVYGAVWNDYAEFRQSDVTEPGRVVIENGDGTLSLSTKRLQRGAEVISDTYGFAIGETDECKTPIAATGRVLAYTYEPIEEYKTKTGWPVCSGPNGTVSIMTEEEEEKYPSRIIGTISEVPDYEEWGSGKVKTNGRVWIRIK